MPAAVRKALGFLIIFLVFPLTAYAGPKDVVEAKQNELASLLKKGGAASDTKISSIFDQLLDYQSLAEHSLGKHWGERTEAERKEFTSILEGLVKAAYRRSLRKTLDYQISIQGESPIESGTLVRTVATHRTKKREPAINIDYALHEVGGQWKIFDIVTEGSSLVKNYQNQFGRVIRKKGFAELLSRMKKKLAQ